MGMKTIIRHSKMHFGIARTILIVFALLFTIAIAISFFASCSNATKNETTESTYKEMNAFIDNLMNEMTIDEKIGQLNLPSSGDIKTGMASSSNISDKIRDGKVGGLFNIKTAEKIREVQRIAVEESRLGIPLIFAMDVIHGYKTVFPIPLGLSCSWDMDIIEQVARISAEEASADGICLSFSPMVDISRDPRWGRVAEGGGEDPYLAAEIAKAMVKGYQGESLADSNTIMACVKHFALYGASEAGRDYNTVDMSRIRMYNEYFPPYKAAIEAGAGNVMTSFNDVDGIPASANKWLLDEVLRNQWGFDGFIVTDYTTINEMVEHGLGDLQTVSGLALEAGIDMDMVGEGFLLTLKKSLEEGKIHESQINKACRRILEAKYKLGLFEDPYRYCNPDRVQEAVYTKQNREQAREIAANSFVLLKNEGNILPLQKKGTIALIGPLAKNRVNMPGTWSVAADFEKAVSIYDGLTEAVGDRANILYAKGANVVADPELEKRISMFGKTTDRDTRSEKQLIQEALKVASKSDVIVAVIGEASEMNGECTSRTNLNIPDTQQRLVKALLKTGKPVVMVLLTGRPLALSWENENVPAILNIWFGGSETGYAVADVLFGDVNPSGKLTMTFPQNVGQVPLYYNHKNTGRPLPEGQWFTKFLSNYIDVSNDPVYPFGYGLSYTEFSYGSIEISDSILKGNQALKVSVKLSNTGKYAGKEVVQLYVRDVVGTVTRPVKELKGFQKIFLEAGETKTIEFTLSTNDLLFYNYNLEHVWEPGEFEIMVGTNSRDVQKASIRWNN
jgi:beta-glucosidase